MADVKLCPRNYRGPGVPRFHDICYNVNAILAAAIPRFVPRSAIAAEMAPAETRTVVAELVGINIRSRRFEIIDIKSGETVQGAIDAIVFHELKRWSYRAAIAS